MSTMDQLPSSVQLTVCMVQLTVCMAMWHGYIMDTYGLITLYGCN